MILTAMFASMHSAEFHCSWKRAEGPWWTPQEAIVTADTAEKALEKCKQQVLAGFTNKQEFLNQTNTWKVDQSWYCHFSEGNVKSPLKMWATDQEDALNQCQIFSKSHGGKNPHVTQ